MILKIRHDFFKKTRILKRVGEEGEEGKKKEIYSS
jgi:hypothetical protein